MELINKIYESNLFVPILITVIVILTILFIVVAILGKKDKNKLKVDDFKPTETDTFKEIEETPQPLEIESIVEEIPVIEQTTEIKVEKELEVPTPLVDESASVPEGELFQPITFDENVKDISLETVSDVKNNPIEEINLEEINPVSISDPIEIKPEEFEISQVKIDNLPISEPIIEDITVNEPAIKSESKDLNATLFSSVFVEKEDKPEIPDDLDIELPKTVEEASIETTDNSDNIEPVIPQVEDTNIFTIQPETYEVKKDE